PVQMLLISQKVLEQLHHLVEHFVFEIALQISRDHVSELATHKWLDLRTYIGNKSKSEASDENLRLFGRLFR
ncbi:UNVERIFIED_CONTAM: hypothetical protein NY603_38000, partial [Bacteroidetes bacterium 56_B9]